MVNGPKNCSKLNHSPLPYLLITWNAIQAKKSLWVICKILGLSVNPLTTHDKYSLLNRGNLLQHFQMHLSQKRKFFLAFFSHFLNLDSIFNNFKKKYPSYLMYFWFYGPWKNWLDKCLKSPVSEDPSTSNMLNSPKKCSKLNDSAFTIFIDLSKVNSGWKSLSELYAKC